MVGRVLESNLSLGRQSVVEVLTATLSKERSLRDGEVLLQRMDVRPRDLGLRFFYIEGHLLPVPIGLRHLTFSHSAIYLIYRVSNLAKFYCGYGIHQCTRNPSPSTFCTG
jgi:hypothetical protein